MIPINQMHARAGFRAPTRPEREKKCPGLEKKSGHNLSGR